MSPMRAPHPCAYPGCAAVVSGAHYCPDHAREKAARYDSERGSAQARGYGATWRRLRALVLNNHPVCVDPFRLHVGRVVAATDVDHIVPRRDGGRDTIDNLQPLCHECHSFKTARHDGGFGHA